MTRLLGKTRSIGWMDDPIDDAMRDIAKTMAKQTRQLTPVRTGRLMDSIQPINPRAREYWLESVYYGRFVDKGTRHVRARNFTKKAVKVASGEVERRWSQLGEEIGARWQR